MQRRPLIFFLVALLATIYSSFNFFHTETDGQFDPTCPACQFQASSLSEHETPAEPGTIALTFARVSDLPSETIRIVDPDVTCDSRAPPRV